MPWGRLDGKAMSAQPLERSPFVSVVIPCHNYGRFLTAAVQSVTEQQGVELEVIVIDDCSTDDTAEVARALAASDSRVKVLSHARNLGHIATYNEGLEAARGEYIVLMSADDLLTPGSLARATALLEHHREVGFAYGQPRTFTGSSPPPPRGGGGQWTIWSGHDWIRRRCRRGWNVIRSPELVIRGSLQRAIGGYRADLPRTADLEMWIRAASVSDVGRVDGVDQAFYRLHRDSMSHTAHAGERFQLQSRHDAFASLPEAGLLPDAEQLYGQARRALALIALRKARSGYRGPDDDARARELMDFARSMYPRSEGLLQWRALQWQRRLLTRLPHVPARAVVAVTEAESALYWEWMRRTGM